jgi:hypothetical protein
MLRSLRLYKPSRLFLRFSSAAPQPASDLAKDVPGFRSPGVVATDYELASGTERFELLEKLEG